MGWRNSELEKECVTDYTASEAGHPPKSAANGSVPDTAITYPNEKRIIAVCLPTLVTTRARGRLSRLYRALCDCALCRMVTRCWRYAEGDAVFLDESQMALVSSSGSVSTRCSNSPAVPRCNRFCALDPSRKRTGFGTIGGIPMVMYFAAETCCGRSCCGPWEVSRGLIKRIHQSPLPPRRSSSCPLLSPCATAWFMFFSAPILCRARRILFRFSAESAHLGCGVQVTM